MLGRTGEEKGKGHQKTSEGNRYVHYLDGRDPFPNVYIRQNIKLYIKRKDGHFNYVNYTSIKLFFK